MKRNILIFSVLLILIVTACRGKSGKTEMNSHAPSDTGKAVLTFVQNEHDFGKVREGEKVGCIFTFLNTGTADLVITSAITSCGCTVPKYDAKPISPGEAGNLEVIFDTSGRFGIQTKTVTVKSNASVPVILLMIKAEVITSSNN
jgi:hypothetical protein